MGGRTEAEINLQLKFFPVEEEGGGGEEICNFKQLPTSPQLSGSHPQASPKLKLLWFLASNQLGLFPGLGNKSFGERIWGLGLPSTSSEVGAGVGRQEEAAERWDVGAVTPRAGAPPRSALRGRAPEKPLGPNLSPSHQVGRWKGGKPPLWGVTVDCQTLVSQRIYPQGFCGGTPFSDRVGLLLSGYLG